MSCVFSHIWEEPISRELGLNDLPKGDLTFIQVDGAEEAVLAYKFDIYAVKPLSRDYIFVDANTGEVVQTYERFHAADVSADGTSIYNGTVDFLADSFSGGYRLRQATNGVETYDLNNGTDYGAATDITSNTTSFTDPDTETGVQAHFGAEATLQYFLDKHGRDSYDDNGAILRSYVSYSTDYANAFWDGSRMTYGDGNGTSIGPLVSLDIVGHEVSHGVTEFSAGLIYQNESGALNESFSDIFGESVENFAIGTNDWLMGDDIGIGGSGAFRSMSDPNSKNDPDTYLGDFWFSGTGDNGGVHTNSGVQNKWFYILTVGEAGTNDNGDEYDVTGLGMDEAGAIAYRNLTTYLTQSSDYYDAREGAIQSAIDLFGVNSQQHLSTAAAWDAVGVYGTTLDITPTIVLSQGAGIYHGSDVDNIAFPMTTDSVKISVDQHQNLTLIARGLDGLIPTLELTDPNDNVVGTSTTSGNITMIENLGLVDGGEYTITIGGASDTTGEYQLDVMLNAGMEAENLQLGTNNTLGTSEDIDATAWVAGANQAGLERLGVYGFAGTFVGEYEDFESGSLGSDWATSSSHTGGRIVVTDAVGSVDGDFSLFMDQAISNNFNLNEAIWTVDVSTLANPVLSFHHAEWSDETHVLPATFTGSENGDGVAISDDGVNWYTVLTNTDTSPEFELVTVDLVEAATAAGMTLGVDFQVKFQQYDNWNFSSDGRAYDAISITDQVDEQDWYSFNVDAGQSIALAASSDTNFGTLQVDLYDGSGNLLAAGAAASNSNSHVSYANTGAATTLYAKVEGNAGEFSLAVTRGSAFDIEPNDSSAQSLDGFEGILGFTSNLANSVVDPDSEADESILDAAYPGVILSNSAPGGGSIYSADATGFTPPTGTQVFAPGPNSPSGFRDGDLEFRADFVEPVLQVSIDVGSDDASDVGFLRAFDSQGNLLEEVVSSALASGESETLTITRSTAEIAYIIAAGEGTDITPLDNFFFDAPANHDLYESTLAVGDQITLNAYLPGEGPFLFNNGLDVLGDRQLHVELTDPNGSVIGDSVNSLTHVATIAGTYGIRIYAAGGGGEYFVEQLINRAPVAVDDSATTDEDNLVNIDVLANDSDAEGTTLSVTGVTTPANGTATIKSDGTIDYQPTDDFFGSDSFEYTVTDADGLSSTAVVNVAVNEVNDAPNDLTLSANSIAENTNTDSAVEIGLLSGSDVDSSSFTYDLVSGTGDSDNGLFQIVGDSLQVKPGVTLDYETTPQYTVRVEVSDGELTFEKQLTIDVIDRVEVADLMVGDGTSQRSMLENLVITFDGLVNIDSGAFALLKRGTSGGNVNVITDIENTPTQTIVKLLFSGSFVESSGSLSDGNYQLTIDGSKIQSTSTGEFLDGDEDGIAGGDFVFGDVEEDGLFRFFGDVDGDRLSSSLDLLRFRQAFGSQAGEDNFDERFDKDKDDLISSLDLLNFRQNFGNRLDFD
jgi:Zn-dependent metalloprotease